MDDISKKMPTMTSTLATRNPLISVCVGTAAPDQADLAQNSFSSAAFYERLPLNRTYSAENSLPAVGFGDKIWQSTPGEDFGRNNEFTSRAGKMEFDVETSSADKW